MKYDLIDYKGKYQIIQDKDHLEDDMDIVIGEIDEKELTDDWLKGHIEICAYYGIPSYCGGNKELKARISTLEDEVNCKPRIELTGSKKEGWTITASDNMGYYEQLPLTHEELLLLKVLINQI